MFTRGEAESRFNVLTETYAQWINVEARTMVELATTMVLPAAVAHQRQLAETVTSVAEAAPGADLDAQRAMVADATAAIARLQGGDRRAPHRARGHQARRARARASGRPRSASTSCPPWRAAHRGDALEQTVDDDLWPLPKYREMLFVQ